MLTITRGQLGDDLGIRRPLPRRLLCLRVGVVGPAISRLVLKPYLRLAAGRGEGNALWRDQESKLMTLHKCRDMEIEICLLTLRKNATIITEQHNTCNRGHINWHIPTCHVHLNLLQEKGEGHVRLQGVGPRVLSFISLIPRPQLFTRKRVW